MMPLLLRNRPHLIHKCQRLLEIRKRERPHNVMPIHHLPPRHLFRQCCQLPTSQRRHSSPARHTILLRKLAHKYCPPEFTVASDSTRISPRTLRPQVSALANHPPALISKNPVLAPAPSAILLRAATSESAADANPAPMRTIHAR